MQEVSFDGGHTWREVTCTVSIEEAAAELREELEQLRQRDTTSNQRATDLLLEHLDGDQRASYEANGTFTVEAASGRAYTLGRGDKAATCAEINRWWCLEPRGNVPRADWLLAIKLFLEADEAGFLEKANEFVLDQNRLDSEWIPLWQFNERPNCICDIEFTGPIHLETLEDARSYAERQNWHIDVTIDREESVFREIEGRDPCVPRGPTYEVDGRVTDERTIQLLWQVFQSRDDGAFIPGSRGAETLSRYAQSFLAGLPCPSEPEVREPCE